MASPFRADRSPLEKPGPTSPTFRPWMDGTRQPGWPSLLVTFLLATQEKSNSGAAGARNRFVAGERAEAKAPSPPTPLPQAGEGSSIAREREKSARVS